MIAIIYEAGGGGGALFHECLLKFAEGSDFPKGRPPYHLGLSIYHADSGYQHKETVDKFKILGQAALVFISMCLRAIANPEWLGKGVLSHF